MELAATHLVGVETYSVGVTGHRKLLKKESEVRITLDKKLKELLVYCQERNLQMEVNTGMALGFDQLVCDACLSLEVPYVAVAPCDAQDGLWNPSQRERYASLLSKASRVVVVNPGAYEVWKLHARNKWIVDNSQEMIVHWDGYYQRGTGGCMRLVKAKGIRFTNTIDPVSLSL